MAERFSQEKKDSAVKLAQEIGTAAAQRELGKPSYATLLKWVNEAEKDQNPVDADEAGEVDEVAKPEKAVDLSTMPSKASTNGLSVEEQNLLLQQENAWLREELTRYAEAIHALTPLGK